MYITSFRIEGFGIFSNFGQDSLPPGLVLFYGENEAGKSTLLVFLRAMFFGFATKSKEDPNKYPPLRGGNHAGLITLRLSNNSDWRLRRTFVKPKRFEIFDTKGPEITEHKFNELLGGASKEMYRNVYAFSLRELQALASLQSDEVKSALYGATMGSGLRALGQAEKEIDGRLSDLFGPRAQERLINRKLHDLSEARQRVEQLSHSTIRYADLHTQIQSLDEELKRKETEKRELDEHGGYLDNVLKHYPEWQAYQFVCGQHAALDQSLEGFQEAWISDFHRLKTSSDNLDKVCKDDQDALAALEQKQISAKLDTRLLSQSNQIQSLFALLSDAQEQFRASQELQTQVQQKDTRLAQGLSKMGANWDASRVAQVFASAPDQNEVLGFEQRFTSVAGNQKNIQEQQQIATEAITTADSELALAQEQLGQLPLDSTADFSAEQLAPLRTGVDKFTSESRELTSAQSEIIRTETALTGYQSVLLQLLGGDVLPAVLNEVCNPELLDSSQAARTIANLSNRAIIQSNKDSQQSADNAVRSTQENVDTIITNLETARQHLKEIGDELAGLPAEAEAGPDLAESVASERGKLTQLFDHRKSTTAELTDLQGELNQLELLVGSSLEVEQQSQLDMSKLRQASNTYQIEAITLSSKLGDLNKQIAALNESITSIKSKHQRVQSQLVQFADVTSDPATILQELTSVQNLRKLIVDFQALLTDAEVLSARISDKSRAKQALEQSSTEKSSRYNKLIALLIAVIGLGVSVYLGMTHGVVVAACGVIVTATLAFLLLRTPSGTAAPVDSSANFAQEIVQLEAQLGSIEKRQHEQQDSIAQLSAPLSLPSLPSLEQCDVLQHSLSVVSAKLAQKATLSADAFQCEEELARLADELSEKQQELSAVEISRHDYRIVWQECLQSIGINNAAEPDAIVPDIERLVETSKKVLKLQKSSRLLEQDLAKITSSLTEAGVVVSCDHPDEQDWLLAIESCLKESTAARALANKRSLQQNRFNDGEKSCQVLEKDLTESITKRDSTLASQTQAQLSWQQWLTQVGLPSAISCDQVLSLADNLTEVSRLRNDLRTQQALTQSLHQSTQLYRALAGRVPFIGSKAQALPAPELSDLVLKLIEMDEEHQEYDKKRSVVMERIKASTETAIRCKNRIAELLQLRDKTISEHDGLLQDWRTWLLHHSLDADLTTQIATEILPIVNSLQILINEKSELLVRQSRAQEKVQQFQQHCKELFSKLELEDAHLPESFEKVSGIHKTLQDQLHLQTTNVALTKQIQDARQKMATSTVELQTVTSQLELLLSKAGVESSDRFEQRQNQFKEYQQLVLSILNQQVQLTKLLGKTGFSDVEAIYAAFDMSETLRQANQLKLKAETIGEALDGIGGEDIDERTGLRHKIGNLINERDRLAQSHDLVDGRLEEERLQKELEDLSLYWARYTVAKHLLTLAKQRFEKEGQPHVIEMASGIFTDLTNGKYISVIPMTDQPGEFSVEDKQHDRVAAEHLSTGTQEQLYLALRLAFIKHRASQAEPLPIIMDDVLVNFDDVRASQAANVVCEFSSSHQVLYFTCHPSTVAMFRTIDPDVQVINLSPSKTADQAINRLLDKFQSNATLLNARKPHE